MFAGLQLLNKCIKMYVLATCITMLPGFVLAQTSPEKSSPKDLKQLSIEELMDIEVTSVSKTPEKLAEVASAIQVITRQDILRSAATSIPEALRLAPNLQVSQLNSRHWIISARGFNSVYSNKLLVMIDGRTVYSPLFAGVFWDAQNTLLEDVDRIEVISGPGGTLWGANAVNGVINIITRNAKNTQGLYVSESAGSALQGQIEARYGGHVGSELNYRIYAQYTDRNRTFLLNNTENSDTWKLAQSGFFVDWDPSSQTAFTLQGNFYGGKDAAVANPSSITGQNVLAKWSHNLSSKSGLIFQAYFDRTWRHDVTGTINDKLLTYDFDLQQTIAIRKRYNFLWGAGYRFMDDQTANSTEFVGFLPNNRKMSLFSGFVQNEFLLKPDRLKLIIGTKLQHQNFSGFEWQPSTRLSYTPFKQQIVWAAVSRAVRAPSRIDVDYRIPAYDVPPNLPSVAGGPNFHSEKVIAYELGYRVQPVAVLSLSLAGFYNKYDDLYSVEPLAGTLTYQIQNGAKGKSYGAELSGNYRVNSKWRLRGGYTFFYKKLQTKPGNASDPATLTNLGSDAKHQTQLHSIWDMPANFQFDILTRYVDELSATQFNKRVPSYYNLDTRIGWKLDQKLELSIAGQNLLKKRHIEVDGVQIARSVYGKIIWRLN